MRPVMVIGCLLFVAPQLCAAKVLLIPSSGKNVNQLQEELLKKFPDWRGTPKSDGGFTDPLMEVERTDTTIRLTVPDDADETVINQVLSEHVPKPPKNLKAIAASAKSKLKALGFTDDEIEGLVRF